MIYNYDVNCLTKILRLYPNREWDWRSVSANPNITWEFIINNPDYPWDWYFISCNPNITLDIIRDNPNYEWDFNGLSRNTYSKK